MTSARKRLGIALAVVMAGATVLVAIASGGERNMLYDIIDGDLGAVQDRVAKGEGLGRYDLNEVNYQSFYVNLGPGMTPLHVAAYCGRPRIAEFLLSKGADINAHAKATSSGEPGPTPLHIAVMQGQTNMVDWLLRKGADMEAETDRGLTPLMIAFLSKPNTRYDNDERKRCHFPPRPGQDVVARFLQAKGAKTTVFTAICMTNGIPIMQDILQQTPALARAKSKGATTPLHLAARLLNMGAAKLLIAKGADVNAKNEEGETPIFTAIFWAETSLRGIPAPATDSASAKLTVNPLRDFVELVLNNGASIQATWCCSLGCHQGTPLIFALSEFSPHCVWNAASAVVSSHTDSNVEGCPAFGPALTETAELLIKEGANVNAKDADGFTALHLAATHPASIAALLISKGAVVNATVAGRSPLHCAVSRQNTNMVGLLLDHGANTDVRDDNGRTALDLAGENGQREALVKAYRSHNIPVSEIVTYSAAALCDMMNQNKPVDDILAIIDKDPDVAKRTNNYGNAVLHDAAWRGQMKIVERLLDKKADVNAQGYKKETPLHRMLWGSPTVANVDFLLDHGADLALKDESGYTPLHRLVAISGRDDRRAAMADLGPEIVAVFLTHGADANAKDNQGISVLQTAKENKLQRIVDLLVKKGAKE